jgi:glucan phosphoethanolaminetransferase (alkaline phosphatase superfamily)
MPHRLFRLLTMVWVGSQLTIGYLVAPVLFTMLERGSAGMLAARLFYCEALFSVVAGVMLLMLGNQMIRRGDLAYRRLRWPLLAMLLCTLVGYFVLAPFMEALRSAAEHAGSDVGHSMYAARFGILHGASSVLYGLESLFGIMLVWRLPFSSRAF